jgi:hypothetical protein
MKRYRVLKDRFVYRHSAMASPGRRRPGEYEKGDVFAAAPCPLLRRAVRDGDIDPVEVETGVAGRRPTRTTVGAGSSKESAPCSKDDTP